MLVEDRPFVYAPPPPSISTLTTPRLHFHLSVLGDHAPDLLVKGWNALPADVCEEQPDWDANAVVLSHISTTTFSGNAETDHQGGRQRYPYCLDLFLCLSRLNRRTGPYRYILRMSVELNLPSETGVPHGLGGLILLLWSLALST